MPYTDGVSVPDDDLLRRIPLFRRLSPTLRQRVAQAATVKPYERGTLLFAEGDPADTFMVIVGVIEIVVGIGILTALPAIGSYVASAWLLLVAVNLTLAGYFDVAVRDLVLSVGAFMLARLIRVKGEAESAEPAPARVRHASVA